MPEDEDHQSFDESVSVAFLKQVEPVCTKFEKAWQRGKRPELANYLGAWEGAERVWLLRHLILLELEFRSKRGEQPTPDEYHRKFPNDIALIDVAFLQTSNINLDPSESTETFPVCSPLPDSYTHVCQQFEQAWKSNQRPYIEEYLSQFPDEQRDTLLYRLLLLELELLDKSGIQPDVSKYMARLPDDVEVIENAFHDYFPSQVCLEVIIGPHKGRKFTFTRHDNFLVGRARYAHFRLPLKDPYFSRVHFMVEVNPPHCQLVDLCSLNGTKVNGQLVDSAILSHGDLVQGGDTVMMASLAGFDGEVEEADAPAFAEAGESNPSLDVGDAPSSIGGYEVVRPLGRGGMGVVYLARRASDGTEVALKTIRPAVAVNDRELQRFLREAQILCALKHPNIVTFHQMGREDELFYIVMDYVRGMDAAKLLKQSGPLPLARAVKLICQVLDALDYAHGQGFVHRDVKPANMLLGDDAGQEVCHLADFGLARVYYESRMSGITTLGNVGGTIPYMAPEQITNYRDAQPPTDQYAAAATLYHLLTGHFVHDVAAGRHNQRLMKILLDDPIPILKRRADIPQRLAATIHRALAKIPAERFGSAAEFRHELLGSLA